MARTKAQDFASKRNWTKRRLIALSNQILGISKEREILTDKEMKKLDESYEILDDVLKEWNDEYHEAKEEYLDVN